LLFLGDYSSQSIVFIVREYWKSEKFKGLKINFGDVVFILMGA
jgi:hypothetical protein